MDGAAIPYDASIWDALRGHANYLAQALQQPLLLPKDMESIRQTKQPDLFMSLKRDLAMVSCSFAIQFFFFFYKISLYIYIYDMSNVFLITMVISSQVTQQVYVAEDWVQSATTNLNAEIQNRYDIEKALSTANHEKTKLAEKLKVTENGRKNAVSIH